jgi:2,3-bisphosphoglycerate-dependent phosphoglycerate mutase
MDVYFVRHGRTSGNVARRHQHPNTPLNPEGEAQARRVAPVVAALTPTHLITSTNLRAVETAKQIAQATNLIPETYPAFEELHRSEFLIGERLLGLTTLVYVFRWYFGIPSAAMHDGESYADFRARLSEARSHLQDLPTDSRVVVVSHGAFINFFVEHMVHPRPMGIRRACVRFFKTIFLPNTSITHVRFDPEAKHGTGWTLIRR